MIQERVNNVAITCIAPEREVCKREYNHVIWIFKVVIQRVVFYISAAVNLWVSRFKEKPVFTTIVAITTLIIDMDTRKAFFRGDVLGNAVRTVSLWFYCVESLNLHFVSILFYLKWTPEIFFSSPLFFVINKNTDSRSSTIFTSHNRKIF